MEERRSPAGSGSGGDAAAEHELVGRVVEHDALARRDTALRRRPLHVDDIARDHQPRRTNVTVGAALDHDVAVDGVVDPRRRKRPHVTSRNRSDSSPTTTVAVARSTSTTNRFGPPPGRPSPLRWPTVTSSMAGTSPTGLPAVSTTRAGCNERRWRRKSWRPPVDVMKHTSWLSGLAAVRSPSSAAMRPQVGLPVESADREQRAAERRPGRACARRSSGPWPGRRPAASRAPAVAVDGDPGVVPGGHGVEAEHLGTFREAGELHAAVALDARVRGRRRRRGRRRTARRPWRRSPR